MGRREGERRRGLRNGKGEWEDEREREKGV